MKFAFLILILAGSAKAVAVTYPSRQVSVTIGASVADVYKFASDPANLPKWASGLSQSTMKKTGDSWIAESPMGKVNVKFAEINKFGVLDHDVTLPSGDVVHNPLRVAKNGTGSEVVFTVYRMPGTDDATFEKDAKHVETDLKKLKSILEK